MDYKNIALNALGATAIGGVVIGVGYYYMTLDTEIQDPTPMRQFTNMQIPTVKDLLKGKTFLNTQGTTDNPTWKQLLAKHLDSSIDEKKKMPISGIQMTNTPENEESNIGILKNTCEILLSKTDNHTINTAIAENWCTKESEFLKSDLTVPKV